MKYIIYNVSFGSDTILAIQRGLGNPVYAGFYYGPGDDGMESKVLMDVAEEIVKAMAEASGDSFPEIQIAPIAAIDAAFLQPLDAAICEGKPARFTFKDRATGQPVVVEKEYATQAFQELVRLFPECLYDPEFFTRPEKTITLG